MRCGLHWRREPRRNLRGVHFWYVQRERERKFFIDKLLVRIHLIIVMICETGLAPWELDFPYPGSLTSTFPVLGENRRIPSTQILTKIHMDFLKTHIDLTQRIKVILMQNECRHSLPP